MVIVEGRLALMMRHSVQVCTRSHRALNSSADLCVAWRLEVAARTAVVVEIPYRTEPVLVVKWAALKVGCLVAAEEAQMKKTHAPLHVWQLEEQMKGRSHLTEMMLAEVVEEAVPEPALPYAVDHRLVVAVPILMVVAAVEREEVALQLRAVTAPLTAEEEVVLKEL